MNWRYSTVAAEPTPVAAFEPVTTDVGAGGHGSPRPGNKMAKRVYDVFFATLGLILLGPFFGLIAVLVKIGDWGPIFYRQRRVGQYGVPFCIIKFRTMVPDADKRGLRSEEHTSEL